jgi:hypothetical protein
VSPQTAGSVLAGQFVNARASATTGWQSGTCRPTGTRAFTTVLGLTVPAGW